MKKYLDAIGWCQIYSHYGEIFITSESKLKADQQINKQIRIRSTCISKNEYKSCFVSCLIYVICVCLRIVVSNTYCVVFLLCLFSSCVPYVASFSGLSIFDWPFRYSLAFIKTDQQINKQIGIISFFFFPKANTNRIYEQKYECNRHSREVILQFVKHVWLPKDNIPWFHPRLYKVL